MASPPILLQFSSCQPLHVTTTRLGGQGRETDQSKASAARRRNPYLFSTPNIMAPRAARTSSCLHADLDDETTQWAFGPVSRAHTNWVPSNPSPYSLHSPSLHYNLLLPASAAAPNSTAPSTFPRFKDLPFEIRSQIWSLAVLSTFTNPAGMTMATYDARLDRDQPARVLDSEFHMLLAPSVRVLAACREARAEGRRAVARSSKVLGMRILLGSGRLDYYYDRTYRSAHKLDWLNPLLPGAETVCISVPKLYHGDAIFQTASSFVRTLRGAVGDGMRHLCLGAALFGDSLYTGSSGCRRDAGPYAEVTLRIMHSYLERGVDIIPRCRKAQNLGETREYELLAAQDKRLKFTTQRSGREFVEIARVERSGRIKVVADLPGREDWEPLLERNLVPIMDVLREAFPVFDGVHVMTESQASVLRMFEALGWKYKNGNVGDGM